MATDITKTFTYPQFDPDKEIVGIHGYVKSMPQLYGPNFDSTVYSPTFNNIRTGALMSKPHHCTHNDTKGHKMTRRCVTDGHQAYCLEWVSEGGHTVRCGTRFKVVSGGCSAHPAKHMEHSSNLAVKNLFAGKSHSISYRLLNDTRSAGSTAAAAATEAAEAHQAGDTTQEILMQHDEEIEALDSMGALPMGAHTAYEMHKAFNDKKKTQDRENRERRKTEAEARRMLPAGKMGTAVVSNEEASPPVAQHGKRDEVEKKRRFGRSFFKTTKKGSQQDAEKWTTKRGGKNALRSSSQE